MKRLIFFAFIFFGSFLIVAQPVIFLNKQTKLEGIKDQKTGKILTLPKYKYLSEIQWIEGDTKHLKCFMAGDGKKVRLIGAEGIRIISEDYDRFKVIDFNDGSFLVEANNKTALFVIGKGINQEIGWFDHSEEVSFTKEILRVNKDGKIFLLDLKKQRISESSFDDIDFGEYFTSDSSKVFQVKKGKWGMYGIGKKQFIPCEYDSIVTLDNIFLKKNGKWGIADKAGKIKQECLYESISSRYEKMYPELFGPNLYPIKQNGKYGVMGANGNWAIKNEYDTLIRVKFKTQFYFLKNKKMGIVDGSGKEIMPFLHDYLERSDEYFVDEQKEYFYFVADSTHKGTREASLRWGTMDVNGKILQPVESNFVPLLRNYSFTGSVNDDKYSGMWDSTLVGYVWNVGGIQKYFSLVVDSTWSEEVDENGNFMNRQHIVYRTATTLNGGKTGIMGRDGKLIIEPVYEETELPFDKFMGRDDRDLMVKGNLRHVGQIPSVSETEYGIKPQWPILFKLNGKWGARDLKGKEIMPFVYDSIFYDRSPCYFDAGDSAYKARGFQREVLMGFKGNKYGYTYLNGREMCSPMLQRTYRSFSLMNTDSVLKNRSYEPLHEQLELIQIELADIKIRELEIWTMEMELFDEMGNTYSAEMKHDFEEIEKGKVTLFNSCKLSSLSKDWGDEIRMITKDGRLFNPLSFKTQLQTNHNSSGIDSIFVKSTHQKIPYHYIDFQTDAIYLDHYFLQRDTKWYLYKNGNTTAINEGFGFDSVRASDNLNYIAYVGYKHAYYDLKYKGPFTNEADIIFPDTVSKIRMLARDAILSWQEYIRKDTIQKFDSEGNHYGDSIVPVVFGIPQIESGKFNLLDEKNTIIFKDWADQMILPKDARGQQFSITDKNSFVYDREHVLKIRDYSAINMCKKSVAMKIGEEWFLSSASNPTVLIGKFNDVKLEGDKWACLKKKKTVYYSVDGLRKVE